MAIEIGTTIHNKLLVDFAALKFANNATIFNNVKKFFAGGSMEALDCLVIPRTTPEIVTGQSAGNTATTRVYSFSAIVTEQIESTDSDSAGSVKYSRLLNIQDSILDYLQKEPSNLNSWGNSNNINIFKIRTDIPRFDVFQTESGYSAVLDITFSIYVNIIPQSL